MLKTNLMGFKSLLINNLTTLQTNLPIEAKDYNTLLNILENNNDYTYLVLCDGQNQEIVKATNTQGVITLTRAQDGSTLSAFAKGSIVKFSFASPSLIKEYICQTPCCDDVCQKNVVIIGNDSYSSKVNQPFTTTFVFDGTTPLAPSISNLPNWLSIVSQSTNYITVAGVPLVTGTSSFAVAVANSKPSVAVKNITITIII